MTPEEFRNWLPSQNATRLLDRLVDANRQTDAEIAAREKDDAYRRYIRRLVDVEGDR